MERKLKRLRGLIFPILIGIGIVSWANTARAAEIIVDDRDSGFSKYGTAAYWSEASIGYNGHIFWTHNSQNIIDNYAKWQPNLSSAGAGTYTVSVYIPSAKANTTNATYAIFHNNITDTRTVNQALYSDVWVSLGDFYFSANGSEYVKLVDKTGEANLSKMIGFDAVKWATLSFTNLTPSTITTSESNYTATLSATGTNFNNVNQIIFSWTGPDSNTATWNKDDTNWNAKVTVNSDTSMTLTPRVLVAETGSQSKTWNWTVTLKDNTGATASRQFTVTYNPPQPASVTLTLYVRDGSATGPIVVGATVNVDDGSSLCFTKTTDLSGYVTITAKPGRWSFSISHPNYETNSWYDDITTTCTKNAYFYQRAKPAAPVIISPGDVCLLTLTPTLTWNPVPNADSYYLAISKYPYATADPANIIYNPGPLYGISHQVPEGILQWGTKYRWNMQAYNSAGWSPVSNTLHFETLAPIVPNVTLTLYVRDGSETGPVVSDVAVTGSDAAGTSFNQTTNSNGYVTITGKPGWWSFSISHPDYVTNPWTQEITTTCTKHAFFYQRAAVNLTFTDLTPSTITTSESNYTATLSATGTNFNNVNQIIFSWTGPDSNTATWNKDDTNWSRGVIVNSDTSMTLKPVVLAGAPETQSKTWNWTVTLKDTTGTTASRQFTVTYNPQVTLTLYVRDGSDTGPKIIGAIVTGSDAAGTTFNQTTDSNGCVTITGKAGAWSFSISKTGFATKSWCDDITSTCEKHKFLSKHPPNPPVNLVQFKSDIATIIPIGGIVNEPTVFFAADVSDLDGGLVKLQIELRRIDEYSGSFLQRFTQESGLTTEGNINVAAYGLINGNYHWQARTVDEQGLTSEWVSFGNNADLATDFSIKIKQSPFAIFTDLPNLLEIGKEVIFNASASYDPDGRIVSYKWDFGDNTTAEGINVPHIYSQTGDCPVTLTVSDDEGNEGKRCINITVLNKELENKIEDSVSKTKDFLDDIFSKVEKVGSATDYFNHQRDEAKDKLINDIMFKIIKDSISVPDFAAVTHVSELSIIGHYLELEQYAPNLADALNDYGWVIGEIAKDELEEGIKRISEKSLQKLMNNNFSYYQAFVPGLEERNYNRKDALTQLKDEVLNNLSSLSREEINLYTDDLKIRRAANLFLTKKYETKALTPITLHNIKQEEEYAWNMIFAKILFKIATTAGKAALILSGVPLSDIGTLSFAKTILEDIDELETDKQIAFLNASVFKDGFASSKMVFSNTYQALLNIKNRNKPVIPQGEILSVENFGMSYFTRQPVRYDKNPSGFYTGLFSLVKVKNIGKVKATFELTTDYYKDFFITTQLSEIQLPFVFADCEELEPQQCATFTVLYYKDSEGVDPRDQRISFNLLGATDNGIYKLGMRDTIFGTTKIVLNDAEVSEEELKNAPMYIYPITSEIEDLNQGNNYILHTFVENPFVFPIKANLTQKIVPVFDIVSAENSTIIGGDICWELELEPKEKREIIFAFELKENSEIVEIPGALLKIYDQVNDAWIEFPSKDIVIKPDIYSDYKSPTATGDDYNEWNIPANAYTSDEQYAHHANPSSNSIVAELSWDGGASYTSAAKSASLGESKKIYILGGSNDIWGKNWSASDFDNSNFRLRIFDGSAYQDYYNFDFNIPAGVAIEGIEVYLEGYSHSTGLLDNYIDNLRVKVYYSGLIAHYKFENDACDSVGNNQGTIQGNPAFVDGIDGKAISLNNGSYVDLGKVFNFDYRNGKYTWSAWIKRNSGDTNPILLKGNTDQWPYNRGGFGISIGKQDNQNIDKLYYIDNTDCNIPLTSTSTIGTEWTHIAVTFNTWSDVRVYVNGILDNQGVVAGESNQKDSILLGYSLDKSGTAHYFNGLIDEVKIWNRVLSEKEIEDLFHLSSLPAENHSPVLAPIGNKTVDEGQLLEFTISATDLDNQSINYSISGLPEGAYFDSDKKIFSWLPNYDQQGTYIVNFEASDGELSASQDVQITVANVDLSSSSGQSIGINVKVRVIPQPSN